MKVDHKATVIYSNQKTNFRAGYRYSNARLFDGKPRAGVTRVIVVGDWPLVEKAYRKAGVEVVKCDAAGNILDGSDPGPAAAIAVEEARQTQLAQILQKDEAAATPVDRGSVQIPGNWATLAWNAKRKIAAALSDAHIINGAQAEEVIKAELARRDEKLRAGVRALTTPVVTVEAGQGVAVPKPAPKPAPAPVVFNDAFLASETKSVARPTALKVEPAK